MLAVTSNETGESHKGDVQGIVQLVSLEFGECNNGGLWKIVCVCVYVCVFNQRSDRDKVNSKKALLG